MRERPAKPPTRRTSRARARRVPGEQPLRTPPVAPAAKRKTARTRLAEKRLRLRKETRASVSPDEITCQLCGKVYRAITYTHLRSRHDLGAVTAVVAYKRRFGLRVAVSAALNAQQRRARVAYFQRSGTHWTRKRIIDDLRRLEKSGCALSPRRLPSPLYQAIQRTMGSWATAVRRAGFDPAEHRSLQSWDNATITSLVRALARRGAIPYRTAVTEHPALHRAAVRRFGNWARALRASGLDPARHRVERGRSLKSLRTWVRDRHRRGRSVRSSDTPGGMVATARRLTGATWAEFVQSLGIRYPGGVKRMDWSPKAVLAAMRQRRKQGLPLNRAAVGADGQALTHQARNYFGSWDAALRAAGIDPARVRLQRSTWTPAEVIAALRKRHGAGRSLRFADMRTDEPRLVKAAQTLFPSSLARALEAAGLDPALAGGHARRR